MPPHHAQLNNPAKPRHPGRTSFSYMNERTGVPTVLPTASVVSATFKRERRVLIQMAVLVLVYLVCWVPFWTLYTVFPACANAYWHHGIFPETGCNLYTLTDMSHYLQYLGYVNSFINPFIYTGFNKEFRTLFKNIFGIVKTACLTCLPRTSHPPANL